MCAAAVLVPCVLALYAAFPVADDAWLLLLIKERGSSALGLEVANRPVFGWMLQKTSFSRDAYLAIGLTVNVITWLAMAMQVYWLTKTLLPQWRHLGPLAAAMAVAPILSSIQLTTLTVTIPVNLTSVLCMAALMSAVQSIRARGGLVLRALAGGLVCCAELLSEYAVAGVLTDIVFLLYIWKVKATREEKRLVVNAMAAIVVGAAIGMTLFKITSIGRPGYTAADISTSLLEQAKQLPFLVVEGYWRLLAGALAAAAAKIHFSLSEKSFLASALYGVSVAALLVWACRNTATESRAPLSHRSQCILLLLMLAPGLLPAILRSDSLGFVGRDGHLEEYGTRLYLTAVPVAAVVFVFLLGSLARPRYASIVIAMAGFVIGNGTFLQEWGIYRNSQKALRLGPFLEPYIRDASGLTVVVLSDFVGRDYEVTYKASAKWPLAESRRLWVLSEDSLTHRFGSPLNRMTACGEQLPLHIDVTGVRRDGIVARMLYVDLNGNREMFIEPYCLAGMQRSAAVENK